VNPSARFLIPMAVSPVALVMYPRSRDVAPRSLSERAGSPSDRAPSVLSDGSVGLEGVGWDLVVLRHRGEEWKRRLGKTVLVTDREDRYMCGRDRVFFRSSSDSYHHLVLPFVLSNNRCPPEAKQAHRMFWNQFLLPTDARDAFEFGTQQLRGRVTLIRVY